VWQTPSPSASPTAVPVARAAAARIVARAGLPRGIPGQHPPLSGPRSEIHSSLSWLQAGCSADGTQRKVCLSWSGGGSCDTNTSISHACATTYDPRESVKVDTFYETQYICQIIDNPGSIEVDVCHNEPVSCTEGSGCTALEPSGCTELCHECNHIHEFNTGYSGTPESGCDGLTGAELAKCNCLSTCVEHAYFGVKDGKATSGEAEPEQAFDINIGSQTLIDGVWNGVWNTSEVSPPPRPSPGRDPPLQDPPGPAGASSPHTCPSIDGSLMEPSRGRVLAEHV